jgi:hypothetical protein
VHVAPSLCDGKVIGEPVCDSPVVREVCPHTDQSGHLRGQERDNDNSERHNRCPAGDRSRDVHRANVDRGKDGQRARRGLRCRAEDYPEPERGQREGKHEHEPSRARRVTRGDEHDGNGLQRVGPAREPAPA